MYWQLRSAFAVLTLFAGCSSAGGAIGWAENSAEYADTAKKLLQEHVHYPSQSSHASEADTVVVRVQVAPDGDIQAVSIVGSSGFADLDHAAMQAAFDVGRLPPVPRRIARKVTTFDVTVPITIAPPIPQRPTIIRPFAPPADIAYFSGVQDGIMHLLQYPQQAQKASLEGAAIVRVYYRRDGTLLNALLIQSTGHAVLDVEAVQVFRRLSKLPPAPPEVEPGRSVFVLEVPIRFQLN